MDHLEHAINRLGDRFYRSDETGSVRVNEGWTEISFPAPAAGRTTLRRHSRLPPFAKCAKDGAPSVLLAPARSGNSESPPCLAQEAGRDKGEVPGAKSRRKSVFRPSIYSRTRLGKQDRPRVEAGGLHQVASRGTGKRGKQPGELLHFRLLAHCLRDRR